MADQKQNQKRESGYYWVPRALTCNGCKFLNFSRQGCRRNQPPGEVRSLTTYLNGDGYLAMIKPADCDWDKDKTKKKAETAQDTEGAHDSEGKGGSCMRRNTSTPAPAAHDILKEKQTEIALLERQADEAVDLVIRTISGLELINQQISDSMADIDKYAAELAQTREAMAQKRSNNAAIIANFSKLLNVEVAE